MLTGDIMPTNGKAYIYGKDLSKDIEGSR